MNVNEIRRDALVEALALLKKQRGKCYSFPDDFRVACLMIQSMIDNLNEDINTNNKINLAWEDFIKNEDVNIKELRDELGLDLNSFKTLYIKILCLELKNFDSMNGSPPRLYSFLISPIVVKVLPLVSNNLLLNCSFPSRFVPPLPPVMLTAFKLVLAIEELPSRLV